MDIVDAHVHVWRLGHRPQPWIDNLPALRRDFTETDLETAAKAEGVRAAVLVQVLNRADETAEYLRLALRHDLIAAVVGWADLAAAGLDARLDQMAAGPGGGYLAGIRHQAQAERDPAAWLAEPRVHRGMAELGRRGLVCELMLRPAQLAPAEEVVRRLPEVTFVLDHAGKPPITSGWTSPASREWRRLIGRLARHEHVLCKLSGLTTMALHDSWQVGDLHPYTDALLDSFGPGRLVFGSDWPVSLQAGDYHRTLGAAGEVLAQLGPAEQRQVLGGNARRIYRLSRAAR